MSKYCKLGAIKIVQSCSSKLRVIKIVQRRLCIDVHQQKYNFLANFSALVGTFKLVSKSTSSHKTDKFDKMTSSSGKRKNPDLSAYFMDKPAKSPKLLCDTSICNIH